MQQVSNLRQATRIAIGRCRCTVPQRVMMRARLASCDSQHTLDALQDELISRGSLPANYGEATPVPAAIDWQAVVDMIIKIIEDMLADKT